jgi:tripartite-type tricarboxylate transporter receptor subunit TctC
MTRRMAGCLASAALALGLAYHPAAAQYPEKPVTLIIPLGAGGSHDLNARVFSSILPEYLGRRQQCRVRAETATEMSPAATCVSNPPPRGGTGTLIAALTGRCGGRRRRQPRAAFGNLSTN